MSSKWRLSFSSSRPKQLKKQWLEYSQVPPGEFDVDSLRYRSLSAFLDNLLQIRESSNSNQMQMFQSSFDELLSEYDSIAIEILRSCSELISRKISTSQNRDESEQYGEIVKKCFSCIELMCGFGQLFKPPSTCMDSFLSNENAVYSALCLLDVVEDVLDVHLLLKVLKLLMRNPSNIATLKSNRGIFRLSSIVSRFKQHSITSQVILLLRSIFSANIQNIDDMFDSVQRLSSNSMGSDSEKGDYILERNSSTDEQPRESLSSSIATNGLSYALHFVDEILKFTSLGNNSNSNVEKVGSDPIAFASILHRPSDGISSISSSEYVTESSRMMDTRNGSAVSSSRDIDIDDLIPLLQEAMKQAVCESDGIDIFHTIESLFLSDRSLDFMSSFANYGGHNSLVDMMLFVDSNMDLLRPCMDVSLAAASGKVQPIIESRNMILHKEEYYDLASSILIMLITRNSFSSCSFNQLFANSSSKSKMKKETSFSCADIVSLFCLNRLLLSGKKRMIKVVFRIVLFFACSSPLFLVSLEGSLLVQNIVVVLGCLLKYQRCPCLLPGCDVRIGMLFEDFSFSLSEEMSMTSHDFLSLLDDACSVYSVISVSLQSIDPSFSYLLVDILSSMASFEESPISGEANRWKDTKVMNTALCQNCEYESAFCECIKCAQEPSCRSAFRLCVECDSVFHKSLSKRSHIRLPLTCNILPDVALKFSSSYFHALNAIYGLSNGNLTKKDDGLRILVALITLRGIMQDFQSKSINSNFEIYRRLVVYLRTVVMNQSFGKYEVIPDFLIKKIKLVDYREDLAFDSSDISKKEYEPFESMAPPEDVQFSIRRCCISTLLECIALFSNPSFCGDGYSSRRPICVFFPSKNIEIKYEDIYIAQSTYETNHRVSIKKNFKKLGLDGLLIHIFASEMEVTGGDKHFSLWLFRQFVINMQRKDIEEFDRSDSKYLCSWFAWLMCSNRLLNKYSEWELLCPRSSPNLPILSKIMVIQEIRLLFLIVEDNLINLLPSSFFKIGEKGTEKNNETPFFHFSSYNSKEFIDAIVQSGIFEKLTTMLFKEQLLINFVEYFQCDHNTRQSIVQKILSSLWVTNPPTDRFKLADLEIELIWSYWTLWTHLLFLSQAARQEVNISDSCVIFQTIRKLSEICCEKSSNYENKKLGVSLLFVLVQLSTDCNDFSHIWQASIICASLRLPSTSIVSEIVHKRSPISSSPQAYTKSFVPQEGIDDVVSRPSWSYLRFFKGNIELILEEHILKQEESIKLLSSSSPLYFVRPRTLSKCRLAMMPVFLSKNYFVTSISQSCSMKHSSSSNNLSKESGKIDKSASKSLWSSLFGARLSRNTGNSTSIDSEPISAKKVVANIPCGNSSASLINLDPDSWESESTGLSSIGDCHPRTSSFHSQQSLVALSKVLRSHSISSSTPTAGPDGQNTFGASQVVEKKFWTSNAEMDEYDNFDELVYYVSDKDSWYPFPQPSEVSYSLILMSTLSGESFKSDVELFLLFIHHYLLLKSGMKVQDFHSIVSNSDIDMSGSSPYLPNGDFVDKYKSMIRKHMSLFDIEKVLVSSETCLQEFTSHSFQFKNSYFAHLYLASILCCSDELMLEMLKTFGKIILVDKSNAVFFDGNVKTFGTLFDFLQKCNDSNRSLLEYCLFNLLKCNITKPIFINLCERAGIHQDNNILVERQRSLLFLFGRLVEKKIPHRYLRLGNGTKEEDIPIFSSPLHGSDSLHLFTWVEFSLISSISTYSLGQFVLEAADGNEKLIIDLYFRKITRPKLLSESACANFIQLCFSFSIEAEDNNDIWTEISGDLLQKDLFDKYPNELKSIASVFCRYSIPDAVVDFEFSNDESWYFIGISICSNGINCHINTRSYPILYWTPCGYGQENHISKSIPQPMFTEEEKASLHIIPWQIFFVSRLYFKKPCKYSSVSFIFGTVKEYTNIRSCEFLPSFFRKSLKTMFSMFSGCVSSLYVVDGSRKPRNLDYVYIMGPSFDLDKFFDGLGHSIVQNREFFNRSKVIDGIFNINTQSLKQVISDMNISLKFLLWFFGKDKICSLSALRIITILLSDGVESQHFRTSFSENHIGEGILYSCCIFLPTVEIFQVLFDHCVSIRFPFENEKSITLLDNRGLLKLVIDLSLLLPHKPQLARGTMDWLRIICEDLPLNSKIVIDELGLLPFLSILSLWHFCDNKDGIDSLLELDVFKSIDAKFSKGIPYIPSKSPLINVKDDHDEETSRLLLSSGKMVRILLQGGFDFYPLLDQPLMVNSISSSLIQQCLSFILLCMRAWKSNIESTPSEESQKTPRKKSLPDFRRKSSNLLLSAYQMLDAVISVSETPFLLSLIRSFHFLQKNDSLWWQIIEIFSYPVVGIRYRALQLLGITFLSNEGDLDLSLVQGFEKLNGFKIISQYIYDPEGPQSSIVKGLHHSYYSADEVRLYLSGIMGLMLWSTSNNRYDKFPPFLKLYPIQLEPKKPGTCLISGNDNFRDLDSFYFSSHLPSSNDINSSSGFFSLFNWSGKINQKAAVVQQDSRVETEVRVERDLPEILNKDSSSSQDSRNAKKSSQVRISQCYEWMLRCLSICSHTEVFQEYYGILCEMFLFPEIIELQSKPQSILLCFKETSEDHVQRWISTSSNSLNLLFSQKSWVSCTLDTLHLFFTRSKHGSPFDEDLSDSQSVSGYSVSESESLYEESSYCESEDSMSINGCDISFSSEQKRTGSCYFHYTKPFLNFLVSVTIQDIISVAYQSTSQGSAAPILHPMLQWQSILGGFVSGMDDICFQFCLSMLSNVQHLCELPFGPVVMDQIFQLVFRALERLDISNSSCLKLLRVVVEINYKCPPEIRKKIQFSLLPDIHRFLFLSVLLSRSEDLYSRTSALFEIDTSLLYYLSSSPVAKSSIGDIGVMMMILAMFLEACDDLEFIARDDDRNQDSSVDDAPTFSREDESPNRNPNSRNMVSSPFSGDVGHIYERVHSILVALERIIVLLQTCTTASQECRRFLMKLLVDIPGDNEAYLKAIFLKSGHKREEIFNNLSGTSNHGDSNNLSSMIIPTNSNTIHLEGNVLSSPSTITTAGSTVSANPPGTENPDSSKGWWSSWTSSIGIEHENISDSAISDPSLSKNMSNSDFLDWYLSSDQRDTRVEFRKRILREVKPTIKVVEKYLQKKISARERLLKASTEQYSKQKALDMKMLKTALEKVHLKNDYRCQSLQLEINGIFVKLQDSLEIGKKTMKQCHADKNNFFEKEGSLSKEQLQSSSYDLDSLLGALK